MSELRFQKDFELLHLPKIQYEGHACYSVYLIGFPCAHCEYARHCVPNLRKSVLNQVMNYFEDSI